MGRRLVLAGAGHAHMVVLQNIDQIIARGHTVTVVGESDRHYYSGMGPGMLGASYSPEEICFESRKVVESRGGIFVTNQVRKIDGKNRQLLLASGETLSYDVLSCNCGSYVKKSFTGSSGCPVYSVKPIENLLSARARICMEGRKTSLHIGIVGGGPSAAEIAGNLLQLEKRKNLAHLHVHLYCRGEFMARFSRSVRDACREYLLGKGVEIVDNDPVIGLRDGLIQTQSGIEQPVAMVFSAMGVTPAGLFKDSSITTGEDGGLAVNEFLQSVEHGDIFGGGDCITFQPQPLEKVGVYAVRQNPVLYHNLLAALEDGRLKPFHPGGGYLLIFNLGNGYGVLQKGRVFWKGRGAFWLKDYIDRKFMKKFQDR